MVVVWLLIRSCCSFMQRQDLCGLNEQSHTA
uniref:Uncharacterized protein n=1 Tax=Arundo donax TaxID=35708 RepID=A0A0A9ABJ1_ARUDO